MEGVELNMSIKNRKINIFILLICIIFSITACKTENRNVIEDDTVITEERNVIEDSSVITDEQNIIEDNTVLTENVPQFDKSEITTVAFEKYSDLDELGRCGEAIACIGVEIMPTEERGAIGQIKPSGWKMAKYDIVDGKYLYNRCHLIGYQLTGENANEKNLITGTRYMNVEGMLPYENMVADYVKETKNHVMYRVTPVFEGDNLLAKGVRMEAFSVEDNGEGISFNVFVDNVQPGVEINYLDGTSRLQSENLSDEEQEPEKPKVYTKTGDGIYILNTNTMKFHNEKCRSVKDIKPENKESFNGAREWLIDNNYSPCGICNP